MHLPDSKTLCIGGIGEGIKALTVLGMFIPPPFNFVVYGVGLLFTGYSYLCKAEDKHD